MPYYVLNRNAQPTSRDHEVHETSCNRIDRSFNLEDLGFHATCSGAVSLAKAKGYYKADGCFYCSRPCHNS